MRKSIVSILLSSVLFSGCLSAEGPYPPHHIIALDESEHVDVEIVLHTGDLNIGSQAKPALLVGEFDYQIATQKPEVVYELEKDGARLLVHQVAVPTVGVFPKMMGRNQWNLNFYNDKPMTWVLRLDDVNGRIDFNDLDVQWMKMDLKSGTVILDFSKNMKYSRNIWINPGAGHVRVIVPEKMGVQLNAVETSGIKILAEGFQRNDDQLHNAYFNSKENFIFIGLTGHKGTFEVMSSQDISS